MTAPPTPVIHFLGEPAMSNFFSDELRLGRLRRRLSLVELAQKVGVSTATLCRIENGQKVPNAAEIQAIAKALNEVADESKEGIGQDIAKLAEPLKRLRIEINLEDIAERIGHSNKNKAATAQLTEGGKLVIFVTMAQLEEQQQSQAANLAEYESEDEVKYQRER